MPLPCLFCPGPSSCFLFSPARDLRPSSSRKFRGTGGLSCGESSVRKARPSSTQIRSGSRRTSGSALGLFLGRPAFFLEGATRAAAPCGASAGGWPSADPLDRPARAPFFFDAAARFPRLGICTQASFALLVVSVSLPGAPPPEPLALRKAPPPPSPSLGHPRAPAPPSPPGRQRWRPRPRRSRA